MLKSSIRSGPMCTVALDPSFDVIFPCHGVSLQEKSVKTLTPERILQQVKYDMLSANYITMCMIPDCNPLQYWYVPVVTSRPLNMVDE